MSLGIVIKGPEGLVFAADSRVTLVAAPRPPAQGPAIPVTYDNAHKLLNFPMHDYVGAVTYGESVIGLRSAYSLLPEFESKLTNVRLPIDEFAAKLSKFFMEQWQAVPMPVPPEYQGQGMTFAVGGFNKGEPYGRVYMFAIPTAPDPQLQHPNLTDFGITWGGQREFVDRIIQGFDANLLSIARNSLNLNDLQVQQLRQALASLQMQVPVQILSLQDCVDLAVFFIKTTISAQKLSVGIRGVGGPIDIATITRIEPFTWVQQKQLLGDLITRP